MNTKQLREICELTAQRSVLRQYKYHKLSRERLSEAEIRNVMVKILEERKVYYGIEIATKEKQVKKGNAINRSALVDLVIYDKKDAEDPSVFIEFKRAQASADKIGKDFAKMMNEPKYLRGACFFHILPIEENKSEKALKRARNEILKKYQLAYSRVKKNKSVPRWFMLFILDSSARKLYVFKRENICNIERFKGGVWEPIEYNPLLSPLVPK